MKCSSLVLTTFFALVGPTVLASSRHRSLIMKSLAGYTPRTDVTDVAALDKDQHLIHELLADIAAGNSSDGTVEDDFAAANAVYVDGGNSRATAEVELAKELEDDIVKGTVVKGLAVDGKTEIRGIIHDTYNEGDKIIRVEYEVEQDREEPIFCHMGGLQEAEMDNKTGCFLENGSFDIGGKSYDYTYDADEDNIYLRTLAGLSKNAREEMLHCDYCPIPEFEAYYSFFGYAEYAHRWIESALTGKDEFGLKKKSLEERFVPEARADAASRGMTFLNVYMYVFKELAYGVGKCKAQEADAVFHWDSAVALYVGSLQGETGDGEGVMLYSHAQMRCREFRTCGADGTTQDGTAKVNFDIMSLFETGRDKIASGRCEEAETAIDQVIPLMRIPLIQGALRSAYRLDLKQGSNDIPARHAGDAATFTMSLMPILEKCDSDAALKVFENTKIGAESCDFKEVKSALESTYDCLGVSCEDIGGLYAKGKKAYRKNAEPCTFATSKASKKGSKSAGHKAGTSVSILFILGLIAVGAVVFFKRKSKTSGSNNIDFSPRDDMEMS